MVTLLGLGSFKTIQFLMNLMLRYGNLCFAWNRCASLIIVCSADIHIFSELQQERTYTSMSMWLLRTGAPLLPHCYSSQADALGVK